MSGTNCVIHRAVNVEIATHEAGEREKGGYAKWLIVKVVDADDVAHEIAISLSDLGFTVKGVTTKALKHIMGE